MMLAGIAVADRHVIELAGKLREAGCDDTAARLESGYEHQAKLLALSTEERDEILSVLVECPDGLGELRAVLLQQHEWRVREGMTWPDSSVNWHGQTTTERSLNRSRLVLPQAHEHLVGQRRGPIVDAQVAMQLLNL